MCKIKINISLPETIKIPVLKCYNCDKLDNSTLVNLQNISVRTSTFRLTNFEHRFPKSFSNGDFYNFSYGFIKQDENEGIEIQFEIDENDNLVIKHAFTCMESEEVKRRIRKDKIRLLLH